METMKIVIQAIVQGLTEFLPVSSSGHLIALDTFLIPDPMTAATTTETTVALHAGTLLAVLLVFWKLLVELCGNRRSLVIPLAVATIPAACAGLLIVISGLDELLTDPRLTGAMLVVTGFVLWMGEPSVENGNETTNIKTLSNRQAFWIGIAQAFAIVPGLSRSGLTIVVARKIGLPGQQAAQFSFLMSIPVIVGAVVVMLGKQLFKPTSNDLVAIDWNMVGLGVAVSAVVGYGALKCLLLLLEKGRFHWFTFWCIPLGVFLLVFATQV
ncbi:MAG: undecaprenyl-diphosphate phosphatase [Planctomycetaceae bacterium]|jgi:undecaprenyl-diphosphatase|nr:undecaprenyl-diphosphate phosphatase [Planctomycetaceae bacterium]